MKERKPRVLNTSDAALYLGLTPRMLKRWRLEKVNKGPAWVDLDGHIRYEIEELDRYLAEARRQPGDDFAA